MYRTAWKLALVQGLLRICSARAALPLLYEVDHFEIASTRRSWIAAAPLCPFWTRALSKLQVVRRVWLRLGGYGR